MRVTGSDECSFGRDERAPLCLQVLSAYDKVIGSGREILDLVEYWERFVWWGWLLISFNQHDTK